MTDLTSNKRERAIAMIRVSDAGQAEAYGPARQRSAIESGAARHNVEIVRWVEIIDVSGRHIMEDARFKAIENDLIAGLADGVFVAEQSRYVRPGKWKDYGVLDVLKDNKKLLWTPGDRFDPATRGGWYALTVGGMISGDELNTLRERLDGGKTEARKQGKHVGGEHMLPRGVRYLREFHPETGKCISWRWELDPVESALVRRAFELLTIDGLSYEEIAAAIGHGWTGKGIRETMQNPIWMGIRSYRMEAKGAEVKPRATAENPDPKYRRLLTRRAEPLNVPLDGAEVTLNGKTFTRGYLPALVSEEVWNHAQGIIAARKSRWSKSKLKNAGRTRHLAAGIAFCGCGAALDNHYGGRGEHLDVYRCSSARRAVKCGARSVHRSDFDAALETLMSKKLTDAAFIGEVLDGIREAADAAPDPARRKVEAAVAKYETGRQNLIGALGDGEITRAEFKVKMAALDANRAALLAALPAPAPKMDEAEIAEVLAAAFIGFATAEFADKRNLLRRAVRKIVLTDGAIAELTISGGFLGGANSILQSTAQSGIRSASDVVVRFPQPVVVTTVTAGEKRAARWAAADARRSSPEYKAKLRAQQNRNRRKATANPAAYERLLARTAKAQRAKREALRLNDPAAFEALKLKQAARSRARYERLKQERLLKAA